MAAFPTYNRVGPPTDPERLTKSIIRFGLTRMIVACRACRLRESLFSSAPAR
jgi:hypothetical protein